MLVWSLLLMGCSTLGIGLLPDYSQIGVWAPALLIALRLVQGFALGGEWGGAVLMSVEHAPDGRRGFYGSVVALGLPIGIVLSNAVFLISSVLVDPAAFLAWGWRVPFLASAILIAVGLFIRLGLGESPGVRGRSPRRPDAARAGHRRAQEQRHDRSCSRLAATRGSAHLGYIGLVYYVSYATRVLRLSLPVVLTPLLFAAVLFGISVVVCARWSIRSAAAV
jgi:MFS family permease